jgi:hypothetical protein
MPVSFQRAQSSLLKNGFLDTLGSNEQGAEALTETSAAILKVAGEFIEDCEANLIKADRVSSGSLTDSMKPVIVEAGVNNIIDIYINDYYKFVDKGVKGWQDKKGSGSPYQFKRPSGKGKGTSKMVTAIRKWIVFENKAIQNTKVAINAREGRRKKITDPTTKEAIKVSGIVRRDGLKRTGFFTDAVRTLEDKLGRGVAEALRIDVIELFK